ncbi:hypothetical protein [Amycolatopsis sp. NPDC051372]|uniref:hypothetical protein n=1 Tax=Amycolatopsis sp. NPDC051372 TaxID=3155669 RepID=UPI00341A4D31
MADETSGDVEIKPTTSELYGTDGRTYYTAAGSEFAVNGLRDGTLSERPTAQDGEEVAPGGAEVRPGGDGTEPGSGSTDDGSGDGAPDSIGTGIDEDSGTA